MPLYHNSMCRCNPLLDSPELPTIAIVSAVLYNITYFFEEHRFMLINGY